MNAIDVVIPAFNAARYLDEALVSVLSQDHAANRIIVIDDGSTDGTAEAASRFGAPVEITRRDNGGAGAARNTGIARSTAAFVAFLDADDRWIARKLTPQMAVLNADPAIDLVLCLVRAFASPELPEAERAALEAQQPRPFEGWVPGSMLIRRTSFDRVGPFAEDLGVAESVDWFNRARRAGLSYRVIPEVLLERRLHRHNTTRLQAADRRDYLLAAKRNVERVRKDRESDPR
jgi:glycosyltransferase involved in cell wall biosynthesis